MHFCCYFFLTTIGPGVIRICYRTYLLRESEHLVKEGVGGGKGGE